jgi:hypothetical protein
LAVDYENGGKFDLFLVLTENPKDIWMSFGLKVFTTDYKVHRKTAKTEKERWNRLGLKVTH